MVVADAYSGFFVSISNNLKMQQLRKEDAVSFF
jgi:hypothetical protein